MTTENAPAPTASNAPEPGKKYFSVHEANRTLPYVSRIARDVTEVYSQVVALRRDLEHLARHGGDNAERIEQDYEQAMDRLGGLVDELHAVGAELKDFEKGLVDFPAVHQGREVLLCWRLGEEQVDHWHEVDGGFAGRQSTTLLEEEESQADEAPPEST